MPLKVLFATFITRIFISLYFLFLFGCYFFMSNLVYASELAILSRKNYEKIRFWQRILRKITPNKNYSATSILLIQQLCITIALLYKLHSIQPHAHSCNIWIITILKLYEMECYKSQQSRTFSECYRKHGLMHQSLSWESIEITRLLGTQL